MRILPKGRRGLSMGLPLLSVTALPLLLMLSFSSKAESQLQLEPCYLDGLSEKVECGSLTLPENYDAPDGNTIEVHFARLPAIKPTPGKQPLLLISGGPGQSAIDSAEMFDLLFSKVRRKHDLILVDQRGTGRSNALTCPTELLGDALEINDETQPMPELMRQCYEQLSGDVRFYDSQSALKDLEQVRAHLNIDSWHVYGISYGTRMAQLYMRHHPEALNTVTLDGVVPMQESVMAIGPAISNAMDGVFAQCAADESCQQRYPNLKAQLDKLSDELSQKPKQVAILDPLSAESKTFLITQTKLLSSLRMALYSPQSRSLIPFIIDSAANGNVQPLLGLQGSEEEMGLAMGMHLAVVCSEDAGRVSELAKQELKHHSHLSKTLIELFDAACPIWNMPQVGEDFSQPIDSSIPTLLLSGEHDPVTPPAWGELAAEKLGNRLHLISPYATHGVIMQSCAPKLVHQLIEDNSLDNIDSECMGDDTHRAFYLNANSVEPTTRL